MSTNSVTILSPPGQTFEAHSQGGQSLGVHGFADEAASSWPVWLQSPGWCPRTPQVEVRLGSQSQLLSPSRWCSLYSPREIAAVAEATQLGKTGLPAQNSPAEYKCHPLPHTHTRASHVHIPSFHTLTHSHSLTAILSATILDLMTDAFIRG